MSEIALDEPERLPLVIKRLCYEMPNTVVSKRGDFPQSADGPHEMLPDLVRLPELLFCEWRFFDANEHKRLLMSKNSRLFDPPGFKPFTEGMRNRHPVVSQPPAFLSGS